MVPDQSSAEFQNRLRSRGLDFSSLAPDVGFSELFAFYRDVRPIGCVPVEHDGDMLLYRWGTWDWGNGMYFNLNLTRQFVLEDLEDDGSLSVGTHLLLRALAYPGGPKQGSRWCHSPSELLEFQQFVASSNAYRTALKYTAKKWICVTKMQARGPAGVGDAAHRLHS